MVTKQIQTKGDKQMKTRVFLAILLLTVVAILYCSDDPNELNAFERKQEEITAFKAKFESTTLAEGKVEYDIKTQRWGWFRGKFTDLPKLSNQDSTQVRIIFDAVMNRVLPFTTASRSNTQPTVIRLDQRLLQTDYKQSANGYPVIGGGMISIAYYPDEDEFMIGNSTIKIPKGSPKIRITKEEAIRIAIAKHGGHLYTKETDKYIILAYACNWMENWDVAVLCYIVPLEGIWTYVDAESGVVRFSGGSSTDFYTGDITGSY